MVASTQITHTEIFAFIAVLVFKLFSRNVLFINRKDNRNCWQISQVISKFYRILLKQESDHLSVLFRFA